MIGAQQKQGLKPLLEMISDFQSRSICDRTVKLGRVESNAFHHQGQKSLARLATLYIWPYKNRDHWGHIGVGLKNRMDTNQTKKQFVSWWPKSSFKTNKETLFGFSEISPSFEYSTDKRSLINNHTQEKLEEGYQMRAYQDRGNKLDLPQQAKAYFTPRPQSKTNL